MNQPGFQTFSVRLNDIKNLYCNQSGEFAQVDFSVWNPEFIRCNQLVCGGLPQGISDDQRNSSRKNDFF